MLYNKSLQSIQKQSGQTLIETLVAAFILVMGISAALGLASYSLGATTSIRQQIIAMGLAREGIEAVKNMRDTNWLNGHIYNSCYNFADGSQTATCYTDWLNPAGGGNIQYNLGTPGTYAIGFNTSNSNYWYLISTSQNFGLDVPVGAATSINGAWYSPRAGIAATAGTSGFARKVTLAQDSSFAPFDKDTGPRLKVTVQVWWRDKNCPMTTDVPANNKCVVKLETYLTNWKNFSL
jgi:type II secretory pathway pseudopilin PulG